MTLYELLGTLNENEIVKVKLSSFARVSYVVNGCTFQKYAREVLGTYNVGILKLVAMHDQTAKELMKRISVARIALDVDVCAVTLNVRGGNATKYLRACADEMKVLCGV